MADVVFVVDYQDKMRGLSGLTGQPLVAFDGLAQCAGLVDEARRVPRPSTAIPAAYGELVERFLSLVAR